MNSTLKDIPDDLALVLLCTLVCIPFVLLPPLNETPVRIILGLPLVLFLPGYSLIALLFPRRADLDGIERIALSFGLSIAIVPLIGLALNYTPWGIRLRPILIVLSLFTVSLTVSAYVRRSMIPEEERFRVSLRAALAQLNESFRASDTKIDRILSIILLCAIAIAIALVVYVIVTPKQGEKFTEFYILGPGGNASDYPTKLGVGKVGEVIIGVVNHEYALVRYHVEVKLNGELIGEERIELVHNETWESPFTFEARRAGVDQKLEFLLYRSASDEGNDGQEGTDAPYRSLHLWLDVHE